VGDVGDIGGAGERSRARREKDEGRKKKQQMGKGNGIFQVFPKLETVELDAALASPLSVLLYFQNRVQTYPTKPLRRLRQRMLRTSNDLTNLDLPLRVLHLEVERAAMSTSTDLMKLFLVSPLLSELKITLPTMPEIDAMYEMLRETAESSERLETWTIKSDDGYAMSVRLQGSSHVDKKRKRSIARSRHS